MKQKQGPEHKTRTTHEKYFEIKENQRSEGQPQESEATTDNHRQLSGDQSPPNQRK